ncbi:MAG: tetratricopeptide repeat protein [Alphaproteobacteria bacterium]|nr:tetratricopeptide repeat protein [Alphaproteobacteria bacterium]
MPAAFIASLFLIGADVPTRSPPDPAIDMSLPEAPDIEDQIAAGASLLEDGHFDEAIQIFTAVLARAPGNGRALANRAMAYALTNRIGEATRDLEAAARAMPDAAILHRVRAVIADRRGDAEAERAEFSRSLELEPGNPFALRFRAHMYQDAGDDAAAIADADSYIEARPHDPFGHVLKAELLIAQHERARAQAEADLLSTQFPDNADANASAAHIYHALSDRSRALAAIGTAIERDPGNFYYPLWRADMRRWDDFAGRRADLEAALALDPHNGDVITRLGLVDFKEGKWSDAIAHFSAVLVREPRDFGLLAYRALAHLQAGDRALAERDYRAATAAASGPGDLSRICAVFAREGLALDWAMATCDRAVQSDAHEPSFRLNRALAELRLGRLDAALADYNAAIEADAREADGYFGRALVLHRQGHEDAAQADRRRAIDLQPGIVDRYRERGLEDF